MSDYLLFTLDGTRYGVDAALVQRITWLPELTPAEEAPPYIAGLLNLRGEIWPVMDPGLRLGHPPRRYRLGDQIVLLHADSVTMGLIVNEVDEVVAIPDSAIEPPTRYDGEAAERGHFIAGNGKVGDAIITLLDVSQLLHAPAPPSAAPRAGYFCPDASEDERALFHHRALHLMQSEEERAPAGLAPVSVIQLGGECFGVELDTVRQFAHLQRVTPIPCCPPHIVGNMNLRGDILTLADIRGLLNLSTGGEAREVVVVEAGELRIGVPVERVLEVIYLRPEEIVPLPAAAHDEHHEYGKGVARYAEGLVTLLDLRKIMGEGVLEVEESV